MNFKRHLFYIASLSILCITLFSCENDSVGTKSQYISRVYDYVYGPGQHAQIAQMSDTANFIGKPQADKWVYLGGFGGYIVAGFDHNIMNRIGDDFEVFALAANAPEPAIVYVMQDTNGNGLPDDTWYELKGNQFDNSIRPYWVKYYKAVSDSANVTWVDSEGNHGELVPGYGAKYSAKWWWPEIKTDSITFHGTRLPDSYNDSIVNGSPYWYVPRDRFTNGYAENCYGQDYDSSVDANELDISNAVDSLGNPVSLSSIRFIKVETGVFQQAGWLNEVSSEVRGAKEIE